MRGFEVNYTSLIIFFRFIEKAYKDIFKPGISTRAQVISESQSMSAWATWFR